MLFVALWLAVTAQTGSAQGPAVVSFLSPVSYTHTGASGITSVDLDDDGNLDLIVGDVNGGRLSLLYGRGDGTFEPPIEMQLGNGYDAALGTDHQFIGADVNGDGLMDLIVPHAALGKVLVFINQGHRTFAPPVGYPVGREPIAVTTADFNGDGWSDLAVSKGSGSLSILLNRGDGTFQDAGSYPAGSLPAGVSSADLDGDGKIDLAVANIISNNVTVYLGEGNGKFVPAGTYPVGGGPGHVVIADFDGDGKLDIATPNWQDSSVSVLFGKGNGAFKPAVSYPAGGNAGVMGLADFDGDGAPDLACANGHTSFVAVLRNGAADSFNTSPMQFPSGGDNTRTLAVGDFNNDGRPDIAAGGQDTYTVSILLNTTPRPNPAIRDVAVAPSSLVGGCQTAAGVVTLTAPAPAEGAVVTLTSTNPAVTVPASVTVPAGATRVSFVPTVSSVSTTTTGTVTASLQGSGKRVPVTVEPGGVTLLKLIPISVIGGQPVDGAVSFMCPVTSGGVTVALTSSQPGLVTVPPAVAAAPGTMGVTFSVATRPVAASTSVTITAAFAGTTLTASLELRPAPLSPPPPPPQPAVNLVTNGGFEEPDTSSSTIGWLTYGPAGIPGKPPAAAAIPGWKIIQGTVDVTSWYWKAAVGKQSLDLVGDTPGTIEQSFGTEVGKEYLFSGLIAHNPANFYLAEGRGNLFVNRTFLTQLVHQDPSATVSEMRWTAFSVRFRATAPLTTLTISDATGTSFPGGLVLDGLAVTPAGG
jgi:hypothetical protein